MKGGSEGGREGKMDLRRGGGRRRGGDEMEVKRMKSGERTVGEIKKDREKSEGMKHDKIVLMCSYISYVSFESSPLQNIWRRRKKNIMSYEKLTIENANKMNDSANTSQYFTLPV